MKRFALAAFLATVTSASAATPTAKVFTTGITLNGQPEWIAPGPDGNLWFTEHVGDRIGRITPSGDVKEFTIPSASSHPQGITASPDGNVWFTEGNFTTPKVGRITPSGTVTEYGGLTANSALTGITVGIDGNLWAAESSATRLARITPAGGTSEVALGAGVFPSDVATGSDGNLWFTETSKNAVGRFSITGSGVTEYTLPTGTGSNRIAPGPDGNLWFTETNDDKIGRVTTAGDVTEFSNGITAGSQPTEIVAGPDGNLWFTEGAGNIARITPQGVVTEFTGSGPATGIAVGPDANLWFTVFPNGIGRINTDLAPMRFTDPGRIEVPRHGTDSGPADQYPLIIEASGLEGTITNVRVRLNGLHHQFADDVNALLVGPHGQMTALLRGPTGLVGSQVATGEVITTDDAGATSFPRVVSGVFAPITGITTDFEASAPAGPYPHTMSVFNGTDPNGQWKLYLEDASPGFTGVITDGWSLDIQTTGPAAAQVQGPPVQVEVPGPTTTVVGPGKTITVPGQAPADTTRPVVALTGPDRRMTQRGFRAGPRFTVTPSEPVTLDVTLSVKPKRATIAAVRAVTIFERTIAAAASTTVTAKPSPRLLGHPRGTFRAQVRVAATDPAGNRTTVTRTISVRPS